jgi:hypothetical protein
MADTTEKDALGIIYIDAPLPATVLNEAYRMHTQVTHRKRLRERSRGLILDL